MAGSDCEGLNSWIPLEEVCHIVFYKKYIFDHSGDQNIFLIYIWSLSTVPGSQPPEPMDFPKY